jgi:hypothetical protein
VNSSKDSEQSISITDMDAPNRMNGARASMLVQIPGNSLELKSELHATNLKLQAVQRNYETLSRLMRGKQFEIGQVRLFSPVT